MRNKSKTASVQEKMMNNKQPPIDDETWLNLINGSQKADPDDPEQLQILQIRKQLLHDQAQQLSSSGEQLTTKQQEQQYEEERIRLLSLLKKKKLLEPVKQPQESIVNKLYTLLSGNKGIVSFAIIASLLTITLIPLLTQSPQYPTSFQSELPEGMVIKGITEFPTQIIKSQQPKQYSTEILEKLKHAGLDVDLEQLDNGWLISTKLPLPLSDHQDVLAILDEYAIDLPMGGNHLRALFVEDK